MENETLGRFPFTRLGVGVCMYMYRHMSVSRTNQIPIQISVEKSQITHYYTNPTKHRLFESR